jgi:NADH-quinone oxidoreductase subunit N
MAAVGLAFKVSLAPFHQWTPDVYQGAPTPVTSFMAVATKAAAFVALVRLFEVALGPVSDDWDAALAALAVASIVVGNVGALGQDSLKRLLGYSGIAQAGYILAGVVVATQTGIEALVFYLAAYALMNLAVFVAVVVRERETPYGDDIRALEGIGRSRPLLAWPLTIGFLALAGLPGTSGFIAKLFLIEATVDADYTWLGVVIVVGSMVSLVYYLRVLSAVWMRPTPIITAGSSASRPGPAPAPIIAGGAPLAPIGGNEPGTADVSFRPNPTAHDEDRAPLGASRCWLVVGSGLVCGAATVFFGVIPSPLVDWASAAGESLSTFV